MTRSQTSIEKRPLWLRWLMPVLVMAVALSGTMLMEMTLGAPLVVLFAGAVAVSAWFSGIAPAILATVLGALALLYFFLEPRSIASDPAGLIVLGIYLAASVLFTALLSLRIRVERRLRDREAQYRLLFEQNPHPMWVFDMKTLRFLAVNGMAVTRYGYSEDEFLRMTINDIRAPEDIPRLLEEVAAEASWVGTRVGGLWRHRRKDGSSIDVEITTSPIMFEGQAARLVFAHDVTERLSAERALRQQEEQLRLITDAVPALISYVDRHLYYRFVNAAYEAWFGQPRAAVIGRPVAEVLGERTFEAIEPYLREALEGREASYEQWLPYKDGGRRFVSATYLPHQDAQGRALGIYIFVSDLTARRQAEEALQRSEALFRAMAEASPLGVFVTDARGDCTYANRVFQDVSGLTEEQARGQGWTQAIHPDDREQVVHLWRQFLGEHAEAFHSLHRSLRPDGTVSWTSVRAAPIPDGQGFSGFVGTIEDITEFRRAEQALRRRIDQLQTAYRMTEAVNCATDIEDIYEEAMEGLQHALKADRASILLVDDDGVMRFKAWRGLSEAYRQAMEGHAPWPMESVAPPEPILCSDVAGDPSMDAFREIIQREGIGALGFIPLSSQGRLLGKMMIYYDQPYRFRKEDVELAENMANHIAFAIVRKRVQDQIHEQREQLQAIVTSVPGVVWEAGVSEGEPRLEFVSDHVETMLDYTAEEVREPGALGRIMHPEDFERVVEELRAMFLRGQGGMTEFRCTAKDGRTVWVEARATVAVDADGQPIGMRGVAMDVTDRKHIEEALRDHRGRLAGIISSAMDAIITIDEQQRVVVFNTAAERMFRFAADRAIGESFARFIPERYRQRHAEHLRAFSRTGDSGRTLRSLGALAGVRADGEEFPIEATISAVDAGGQQLYTIIIRDITERVRAERRLAAQHAVTRILADSPSIDDAAPRVVEMVCQTLGWDLGALWMVDQAAQGLRCVQLWQRAGLNAVEFEADSRQRLFGMGRGLPGRIWATGQPVWIADATQDDNFPRAPLAVKEGLRGAFAVPVILTGKVLGVMEFFSHVIQQPDGDLLQMMAAIGSQFGQFIERRRAEEQIKASLAEKEVLLREIHHRVKNNMQVISSLLSLQADHISDPKVLELFEDSQHRIQSMALVHETLYQSRDLSQVNLGDYLRELAEELGQSFGSRGGRIGLSFHAEEVLVGIDTAIPCGLIVNELVSNALKHAFPDGREGEIRIRLRMGARSTFILTVQDTGVGLPEGIDLRRAESLGLRLVTALTEQLDGQLELERLGGTRFTLTCSGLKHQAIRRSVEQALASKSLL